jgi:hypothetical protein
MTDIDKLEALRAGCISLGDPDWTAGCVRLVLEHGQAAVETDDDSIPPGPDCFSAEWITAIHNAAPALLAEVRRLRAIEAAAREYVMETTRGPFESAGKAFFVLGRALAAKENGK